MRCGDGGIFVVLFGDFWIILSKNGATDGGEKLWLHDRGAFYDPTIYAVAFSPDGKRIISAGGNGAILIIDLERLAEQERGNRQWCVRQ